MTELRPSSSDRRRITHAARAAIAIIATTLTAIPAYAGQLQISPTRLALAGEAPMTTLTAVNAGAGDASYQVTVHAWSQNADGTDRLEPTRDILANPGIFTVGEGAQQIIRLGLRSQGLPVERSYRIILMEIPRPHEQVTGIQTLLRISVPIFVPAANPTVDMQWSLRPAAGGAVELVARNGGNVHVQITGVRIADARAEHAAMNGSIYVLPGNTRTVNVRAAKPIVAGTTYQVRVDTDQGPMTMNLRSEPPAMAATN